jgi:ornithine cyclodeaminase
MQVIDAAQIDRLLSFETLIPALEDAFRGGIVAPVRHHHHIARPDADATLLLMPAWTGKDTAPAFVGTKIVTVFPGNATLSLPSIAGLYLLMDGRTGAPLAAMDGARLTLWRTAAASALASRTMARPDAGRLLMVGAGALSRFLVAAHRAVLPITEVMVWNRSRPAADRLVANLQGSGLSASLCEDLEEASARADLISCATLSQTPLIMGRWLMPGCHLDLVGAFNMAMREVDDAALNRARVLVDTDAALGEGGDVAIAIASGHYQAGAVLGTLFDLVAGRAEPRRSADDITLFKSVGASLEDLAAAMLVERRRQGLASA